MNVTAPVTPGVAEVSIKIIPHAQQRYPTVGDWIFQDGKLALFVSDIGDWRFAFCCAIHELTEAAIAIQHGVSQKAIDAFDIAFEKRFEHEDVPKGMSDEPGEQPDAPYYQEHLAATIVERLLCWQLGAYWPEYEKRVGEAMVSEVTAEAKESA